MVQNGRGSRGRTDERARSSPPLAMGATGVQNPYGRGEWVTGERGERLLGPQGECLER